MMAREEETCIYIASGLWRGVDPSFASNSESGEKHSKDVTPIDNSTRNIKWKRPANTEQLVTPTSITATGKNANHGNNNRNASLLKNVGSASTASDLSIQPTGDREVDKSVQNGSSADSQGKSKSSSREAGTSDNNDLYSIPLSPILPRQQRSLQKYGKSHALPSNPGSVRMSSPAMHAREPGLGVQKKRSNQKRVPKRSILDPPETSKLVTKISGPSALQHDTIFQPSKALEDPSVTSAHSLSMQTILTTEAKKQHCPRQEKPMIVISSESEKSSGMDEHPKENTYCMPHASSLLIESESFHGSSKVTKKRQGARLVKAQTQNEFKNRPGSDQSTIHRGRIESLSENSRQESSRKRKLSPARKTSSEDVEKKLKVDSIQMPDEEHDMIPAPRRVHGNPKSLRALLIGDPFSGHGNSDSMAPTEFTAKLLNTTCQAEYAESMHGQERLAHAKGADKQVDRETNSIAQHVMHAFQAAESRRSSSMNRENCNESTRDVWLKGSDPYNGTRHTMSYVCKTILRFLKSKESAIDDVATEYFQRGSVVIENTKTLHNEERGKICQEFEACRLGSIRLFETTHQDIRVLAEKLGGIRLAPVVREVLANDVIARLQTLQDEIV